MKKTASSLTVALLLAAASASESLLDVAEQVTRVGQTIRSFLTASPLSAILYTGNPLLLVLPAA